MSGKKYLVTGSNCFTGSHIVDALLEDPDNTVVGTSRSPQYDPMFLPYVRHGSDAAFRFHQIDLVKQHDAFTHMLDDERPDIVIHVAALSEVALSHEQPIEYFDTNVTGTVRMLRHLRDAPWLERYAHISSAEILGPCDAPAPIDAPFRPSTPYAVSKAAADMYVETLRQNFDFPATIIRSTNVFGAYQQLFKIIPRTLIYARTGQRLQLHGGGTAIKSFIHVRDVVSGLLQALRQDADGTFHFSVDSEDSVRDVVEQTCRVAGIPFDEMVDMVGERLGQDARYWLECSRSHDELGWRPQVGFTHGIQETKNWLDVHWDKVQRQEQVYVHKV